LFSEAERSFNHWLTSTSEEAGFRVFLPQGDGVQSSKPPNEQMTLEARRRAMFDPDKAKIFEADVFLFVLDGRVPDEGTCVQLGIAHSQRVFEHPEKLLV
jgi:nucleoside 2-deoxyribosyltransferase